MLTLALTLLTALTAFILGTVFGVWRTTHAYRDAGRTDYAYGHSLGYNHGWLDAEKDLWVWAERVREVDYPKKVTLDYVQGFEAAAGHLMNENVQRNR